MWQTGSAPVDPHTGHRQRPATWEYTHNLWCAAHGALNVASCQQLNRVYFGTDPTPPTAYYKVKHRLRRNQLQLE